MAEPIDVAGIRSEIQQLAYRYAVAVDSRDVAMLASMFMPDDGSDPAAHQEAVFDRFEVGLKKVGISFLNVGTHLIDVHSATSATGLVYTKSEFQKNDGWNEQAILYRDTYTCVDGRWYFLGERVHQLWYGAPRGTDPLTLPPANWPASQIGMGDVPGTWDSWNTFWDGTHYQPGD